MLGAERSSAWIPDGLCVLPSACEGDGCHGAFSQRGAGSRAAEANSLAGGQGRVGPIAALEHGLFLALNGHPAGAPVRASVRFLLHISAHGACWLVLFAIIFLFGGRRGRRVALTGALAVILAQFLAADVLRGLVQRADPASQYSNVFLMQSFAVPFSFPASRAAASFAALPFLGRGSRFATSVFRIFAVLIAYAGVYSGAHFPSDALGGAVVGLFAAALTVWILGNPYRRLSTRRRRRRRRALPV